MTTTHESSDDDANIAAAPGANDVIVHQDETSARVLRHFRRVFNAVKTHFQQVEKMAGIGGAQLWALSAIAQSPGLGVNDLATVMDIHQTTASNLVKSLSRLALIRVEKNAPDRRAVQLYAMDAGQQLLSQAPGPFAGVLPAALARLDVATLERLDTDLVTLLHLLNTDEKSALTPLAEL